MNGLGDALTGFLVRAVLPLARATPLARLHAVGDALGNALFSCLRSHRRIGERNLEIAFGDAMTADQRRGIVRATFRGIAKSALEFAKMPALAADELRAITIIEGREHLDNVLATGSGLLYYTAHFGNWELMGARLCLEGYPLTAIVRELHNSYVSDLVNRVRAEVGMKVLIHGNALMNSIRALRRNEMLGILADQDAGPGALFVPVFGEMAASVAGPSMIARKTGAPVVPAFDIRGEDGRHTIRILPPLELQRTDDASSDAEENTRRMLGCVEQMIRRYPEQWLWLHKRWRTRPPGDERNLYGFARDGRR